MFFFQGVAAKKHVSLLPAQLTLPPAPPDLSTPPSAGVRRQRESLSWLCLAAGTRGAKPKNTNSDPQDGSAVHERRLVVAPFQFTKLPRVSGTKHRPSPEDLSSCSVSPLGPRAAHRVWYQQT